MCGWVGVLCAYKWWVQDIKAGEGFGYYNSAEILVYTVLQ